MKKIKLFLTFFADLFNISRTTLMKRKITEDIDDDILENSFFEEENVGEGEDLPLIL